jgi:hypothetical protein
MISDDDPVAQWFFHLWTKMTEAEAKMAKGSGAGPYASGSVKMTQVKTHAGNQPNNHITKISGESGDTNMHADGGNGKQTSKTGLPRAYHGGK